MSTEMVAVRPGVWRWGGAAAASDAPDGAAADACGTALATAGGLILIDPPALDEPARLALGGAAGPVRHVVLTRADLAPRATPFREPETLVWAPAATGAGGAAGATAPAGIDPVDPVDRVFAPGDALPGELLICQLPEDAAPGEVAFFWDGPEGQPGEGLLITGSCFPVAGQVPVYLEGVAPPLPVYAGLVRALLAMEPRALAPGRQAPPAPAVVRATGYAAHVGSPSHRRRAAPVEGPRFLVLEAERVLQEALVAPVILRRPARAGEDQARGPVQEPEAWIADPFACTRCGRASTPAVQTCGGPYIARLCPACRALERRQPPTLRVMACAGGCCTRDGARAVLSALRQAIAARGLSPEIGVVPVSCLGECGIGPLVGVQTARGAEPPGATAFRSERDARVRQYALDEDEELDEASERVLARFTALVQPAEAAGLVQRLIPDGDTTARPQDEHSRRVKASPNTA